MISDYTFNAVTKPALLAKAKNLKLIAYAGSPVELLNKSAVSPAMYSAKLTDEEYFSQLPNDLKIGAVLGESKEVAYIGDNGLSRTMIPLAEHEMTMNELVKMSVQRVDQLFNFSRNIVQPFIQQVIEQFQQPAEEHITEDWHLSPVAIDAALVNPVVIGLMSQSADPMRLPYEFDPAPYDKVPADLPTPKTGSQAYDSLIVQLLEANNTTARELMVACFSGEDINPYNPKAFTLVGRRLAQLLLVAYYEENPWPNSGLSSPQWSATFSLLRNTIHGWLARFVRQIDERVKLGHLVFNIDPTTRVVHICQELMDEYKNKGGSVEAVLGALYMQDDNKDASTSVSSLLENQDLYVAAWSHRSSVKKAALDTDWLRTNKTALKNAFSTVVMAMEDGTLEAQSKNDAIRGCYEDIDSKFNRHVEDVTSFVIRIACNRVFKDAGAERIVMAIHSGMCKDIPADEAARDEMTEYVLDWILSGVGVEF